MESKTTENKKHMGNKLTESNQIWTTKQQRTHNISKTKQQINNMYMEKINREKRDIWKMRQQRKK